jgi:hypothetical protein
MEIGVAVFLSVLLAVLFVLFIIIITTLIGVGLALLLKIIVEHPTGISGDSGPDTEVVYYWHGL